MKITSSLMDSTAKTISSVLVVIGLVAVFVAVGTLVLVRYENPIKQIDVNDLKKVTLQDPGHGVTKA
ncbi:MAG: hypothetical protein P8M80_11530, partial [Pirellulaceae bacterium]|nr:hypothetical protein [Pirellulaceae bacterium]